MNASPLYFDHAATTPVDPAVAAAMADCLGGAPGNPSATHAAGRAARERVEAARAEVAALVGAPPTSIVFTSGATESDNLAILGAVRAAGRPRHLVTLRTEHRAVLDPCRRLERDGHRLSLLIPGRDGCIDPGAVGAAISADTPGGKIYASVCAACHMPNGSGVPAMQPALAGSAVVGGDTNRLINVILKGPAAVLPADREHFNNVMPPFGAVYNDTEIASLINYLRKNFAPSAPEATAAQVAAQRAKM